MNADMSKWSTMGNFVFVSILTPVFMLIDAMTGSLYTYKEDSVFVAMEKED